MLKYPEIDIVAFKAGPFQIKWYALAYFFGVVFGWLYARRLVKKLSYPIKIKDLDDFSLSWLILGVVMGGRLGYVLMYDPAYYFVEHPEYVLGQWTDGMSFWDKAADIFTIIIEPFAVWKPGMSFHGGVIGVILAILFFSRKRNMPTWALGDIVVMVVPIGLGLGRIGNFINGELWGRVTDVSWAMVFPGAGPLPRHPSQLYEMVLEGILLLIILRVIAARLKGKEMYGVISGAFLFFYGVMRLIVEYFREPDAHLKFLAQDLGFSMGQLLSMPLILGGAYIMYLCSRKKTANGTA